MHILNYLKHIILKLVENARVLMVLSMNKIILLLIIILKKHHFKTNVCLSDDRPNKHTFICHINDDNISYEQVDDFCSKLGV
jgi:hypothetical protein